MMENFVYGLLESYFYFLVNSLPISLSVCAFGGLALGWATGHWKLGHSQKSNAAVSAPSALVVKKAPSQVSVRADLPTSGSPELQLLERIAVASVEELQALTVELLGAGKMDGNAIQSLWDRWIEVDAAKGFEFVLAQLSSRPELSGLTNLYLGRWSIKDPDAAVAKSVTFGNAEEREIVFSRFSDELARYRPQDFFRLFAILGEWCDVAEVVDQAARGLAKTDPQAVLAFLEKYPAVNKSKPRDEDGDDDQTEAMRQSLLSGLAGGWAKADSNAALAWVQGLKDEAERAACTKDIAMEIAKTQPEEAGILFGEIFKMGEKYRAELTNALTKLGGAWPGLDAEAVLQSMKQSMGDEGKVTLRAFVERSIPRDAVASVEFIANHAEFLNGLALNEWTPHDIPMGLSKAAEISDPSQKELVQSYLLAALARKSPQAALQSARQSLSSGDAKNWVVTTALTNWAAEDITTASAWLATQPPGRERDAAIQGMLLVASQVEPDSALRWVVELSSSEARVEAATKMAADLGEDERNELTDKLGTLKLSEEELSAVRQKLARKP